ncbi:VanW family protein [Thalassorhabdus alkalitolerans]|uniref:VanW family protein n=1 Tax=Thalassorhabdus alkalitolerans TaxID=2282697 RepID=A0ABW0YS14_9BACI
MKKTILAGSIFFVAAGIFVQLFQEEAREVSFAASAENSAALIKPPYMWEIQAKEKGKTLESFLLHEYGYQPGDKWERNKLHAFLKELDKLVYEPAKNPGLTENGEVVEGSPGKRLNKEETQKALLQMDFDENVLEIAVEEIPPLLKPEDLKGITDKNLGSFTTYFNGGDAGRSENINLSAESLHYHIVPSGEEFSFNDAVGERTEDRGYQPAKEIVNQQFVWGIGGGICQTSSTLFNAVEQAGLAVTERHTHSKDIGYVPPGRDATVSWGGPDFRFKNSNEDPILIETKINKNQGELTVNILSSSK